MQESTYSPPKINETPDIWYIRVNFILATCRSNNIALNKIVEQSADYALSAAYLANDGNQNQVDAQTETLYKSCSLLLRIWVAIAALVSIRDAAPTQLQETVQLDGGRWTLGRKRRLLALSFTTGKIAAESDFSTSPFGLLSAVVGCCRLLPVVVC